MAIRTQQIATTSDSATPLLVQGSGDGEFPNISGSVGDPLPVVIQNQGSIVVTIGGPDVATDGGIQLGEGESYRMTLIGSPVSDIPYAIAASGTPSVTVQLGRQ